MDIYELDERNSPLIISVPHAGTFVPDDIKNKFTTIARTLSDTDWHIDKLYTAFAKEHDVTMLKANYSRYVVDLNRPPDNAELYPGQIKVSLCPDKTFDGQDLYNENIDISCDIAGRIEKYWQPYHDELEKQIQRILTKHGYAILYDAHSIRGTVPRLFEGKLPDLNLGTVNGKSCRNKIASEAFNIAQQSSYSSVLNGRFIGGYITRNYGDPENNIHALQMELVQSTYMDEQSFAYNEELSAQIKPVLETILLAITDSANTWVKPKPV